MNVSADQNQFSLIKESKFKADGTLVEYFIIEYSKENLKTKCVFYDQNENITCYEEYAHKNRLLLKSATFNDKNEHQSGQRYEYNKNKEMVKSSHYYVRNNEEIISYTDIHVYNRQNQKIKIERYSDNKKQSVEEFSYEHGNQVEQRSYFGGDLMNTNRSTYDQNNCRISSEHIPSRNVLGDRSSTSFQYNNKSLLIAYTTSSRFSDRYKYEYDQHGNVKKRSHFYLTYDKKTNEKIEILDYFIIYEYKIL